MTDTLPTVTDADLIITLRSPHYDSWVCRLAATRIEELGVGLFLKGLTMPDRDLLAEAEELSIRDVLAEAEETLAGWRRYEDAELPVPRDSPAANADEPEWLRDKLRVLVTRCREIEAERDRLKAESERIREAIGVSQDVEPGLGDIADYIALRDRGDTLKAENERNIVMLGDIKFEIDRLVAEIVRLKAKNERLTLCHTYDEQNLNGALKANAGWQGRALGAETELARAQKELVLVTDTLREAVEDCADQRRRAERLEAQLAQHEQDIERLKAENGALREWRAQVTVNLRNPGGARFDEVPGLITALVEREVQHERDIEAAVRWGFR